MRGTLLLALALSCSPDGAPPDDTRPQDADGDGHAVPDDCDDADPAVHPGAAEVCNGEDDDCDGLTDEPGAEGGTTLYADADGDGWGSTTDTVQACGALSGYTGTTGDCDDADASANPAATESCDGADDDCDGLTDEDDASDATEWWRDRDGDGFGDATLSERACAEPDGYTDDATDCDDHDAAVFPDAPERCNGVDDDCDGSIDEDGAVDAPTWTADHDHDGFGDDSTAVQACEQPTGTVAVGGDCDDHDDDAWPGAPEYCDGHDDDCDGVADEDDALDALTWYADADRDGHGDPTVTTAACSLPSGYAEAPDDCDDAERLVFPGAPERCDDLDNDCDGQVDVDATDVSTWYADADGDSYGDSRLAQEACDQPSGTASRAGDCDDTDASVNPDASETWYDGTDQDCDGKSDQDADGDGDDHEDYGGTDCDDTDPLTWGGADEICGDGVDNDCDGEVDACTSLADAAATLLGEGGGDYAGVALDAGADFDGDGVVDLVVGASAADAAAFAAGAAYVVLGPLSGLVPLASARARVLGNGREAYLGYELATGDMDGDGYADLLTGAQTADGTTADVGAAWLFYGPLSGDLPADLTTPGRWGTTAQDLFGRSVALLDDMDGDGVPDVAVGAPGRDDAGSQAGAAYVFMGPLSGPDTLSTAEATLLGESAGDYAGLSVVDAGDLDGDGWDDLAVGAYLADVGTSTPVGAVYVVSGPLSGTTSLAAADARIRGQASADYVGWGAAGDADTNDDGFADLLVAARGSDAGASDAGLVALWLGPITGDLTLDEADALLLGEEAGQDLGSALAFAGDLDLDGMADLLVGADGGADGAGQVFLCFGPVSGTRTVSEAGAWLEGVSRSDQSGQAVAAGDMDGDGATDVVVGSPYWSSFRGLTSVVSGDTW